MSEEYELDADPVKPLVGVVTSYREDLSSPIDWDVVPTVGQTGVGVDFAAGILAVPLTGDSWAQREQINAMIEARISPMDDSLYKSVAKEYKSYGYTEAILRIAEVSRIQAIARRFAEAKGLEDEPHGGEKIAGKRVATRGRPADWDEAVVFTAEHYGTKAFDQYNTGIRSVNPEWSKQLKRLSDRLGKTYDGYTPQTLGGTAPHWFTNDVVGPNGWSHALRAAGIIAEYASSGARAPEKVKHTLKEREEKKAAEYGEEPQDEKGKLSPEESPLDDDLPIDFEFPVDEHGQFAELRIDDTLELATEVEGYMKRRRRPSQVGRSIGNISRLYTDPERRIFTNKVRVKGGIVVIDISGSMCLRQEDIEAIVEAAPAAVIMAYSNCGDDEPNAWIFAKRGWRVTDIPRVGGRGNGVDGPALTWAIQQRHPGEDIIWVCDGYVTSKNDGTNDALTIQCAQLVKKHKIIMVPSVDEAVRGFKAGKVINKPAGPIRDALLGKL